MHKFCHTLYKYQVCNLWSIRYSKMSHKHSSTKPHFCVQEYHTIITFSTKCVLYSIFYKLHNSCWYNTVMWFTSTNFSIEFQTHITFCTKCVISSISTKSTTVVDTILWNESQAKFNKTTLRSARIILILCFPQNLPCTIKVPSVQKWMRRYSEMSYKQSFTKQHFCSQELYNYYVFHTM